LARIQAVQPGFALTAANAPTIVEICERLDGMPLALELAAARFALLSPEQVLERLEHRFRFLASDLAGRDERHRNLMALLDWSYRLLSDEEQRFLAWLGVFVQGWTVDAATELASALGHGPEAAVDLLTGLVNKSLVTVDLSMTPPRYRLLESLREFALAQLAAIGDEQRARDAHLAFVHRMTGGAQRDMLRGQMRSRMAMLMREHGNIEGAIAHAVATPGSRRAALGIVGALVLYIKSQSEFAFAKELCQRALAVAETPATAEHGRAWLCLGVIGMHMKAPDLNPDEALGHAMRIARETGDQWTEAYASAYHALVLIERGRVDDATNDITVVERASEQMGDALLRGLAALTRAWRHFAQGAPAQALAELEAVRDLGPDIHQRQFIELYIGLALFGLDDHAAAASSWYSAMRNALLPPRNARVIAAILEGCGYLAVHFSKVNDAARFLGAAARIREQRMAPLLRFWIAHHEHALTTLHLALGRAAFEAAFASGGQAREEDVVNEAAARLREFQELGNTGLGTTTSSADLATQAPATPG
jgi:non-specific serine/threonine protein kinase